MKQKLLCLLVLLMTAATGAWAADELYLVVDGTSATLKYDSNKGANDPYLSTGGFGSWNNAESVKTTATTITVDATCKNFEGTSLSALFFNFTALTSINNLENLNMANVTNISGMFRQCSSLTAIDVSSFNTAQVTNMNFLFMGCTSLTTLDLSNFNTASVKSMTQMFDGCSLLENIYVGDGWNTDAVTVSVNMFRSCSKLPNFNSSKLDHTNAHTGEGGYLSTKPTTYKVTLQEGTEDATNWTVPAEAAEGATVTVTYKGTKKVKSVKAVKVAKKASGTDLATITADYEAKDGETLTGTLANNVKISIADGATVTLDGVTINGVSDSDYEWAGITCLGDATIILSGTNTVNGFYGDYPGIQAAAAGKTLIINGTGSLTASSLGKGAGIGGANNVACGNIEIQGGTITATTDSYGAGIGGGDRADCGNITISGGTVNATGGARGAGIGGGRRGPDNGSCGNILISGGTVTATGGEYAAGIGGGRGYNNSIFSSCGTITITSGVTKVTATKGDGAPNSIGAGKYGTCGTVTIGGVEGAITTSPYTYQPSN